MLHLLIHNVGERPFVQWYDLLFIKLSAGLRKYPRVVRKYRKPISLSLLHTCIITQGTVLSSSSAARTIIQLICKILRSVLVYIVLKSFNFQIKGLFVCRMRTRSYNLPARFCQEIHKNNRSIV